LGYIKLDSTQNIYKQERGTMEHLHSIVPPFLFGVTTTLPHWEFGGSTISTENYLRLTPNIKSRVGWLWNIEPITSTNFEIEFTFHVHNTESLGADGFALWLVKTPKKIGSLFGNEETFDGYGIIFDSYDNNADGEEPSISLITNDGTQKKWDYENDLKDQKLGHCRSDYRNPTTGRVKSKLVYENNRLTYLVDTYDQNDYHECFSVTDVKIPVGARLGVTGATGGVSDNHDVHSIVYRNLNPSAEKEADYHGKKGHWDPYEFYKLQFEEKAKEEASKKIEDEKKRIEEEEKKIAQRTIQIHEFEKKEKENNHKIFEELREKLNLWAGKEKEGDGSKKTALLVLEALEQIGVTIMQSSTKADITDIVERVNKVLKEQTDVQYNIAILQNKFQEEINNMMNNLKAETEHLKQEIKSLDAVIKSVNNYVSGITTQNAQITQDFKDSHVSVHRAIENSKSSFGFWTIFLLFQLFLVISIIYYRKYKEIKNNKLF